MAIPKRLRKKTPWTTGEIQRRPIKKGNKWQTKGLEKALMRAREMPLGTDRLKVLAAIADGCVSSLEVAEALQWFPDKAAKQVSFLFLQGSDWVVRKPAMKAANPWGKEGRITYYEYFPTDRGRILVRVARKRGFLR